MGRTGSVGCKPCSLWRYNR